MPRSVLSLFRSLMHGIALIAVLTGGGCLQVPTTAERTASFAPYLDQHVPDPHVGDVPLRHYLYVRTAMLLHHVVTRPDPASPAHVRFDSTAGNASPSFGLAVAIDTRGYFLTANHCLDDTEPTLIVFDGLGTHAYVPRVVWREEDPDLALIHIDGPVPYVFSWAENFVAGDPVLAVGPNYESIRSEFLVDGLAGKLLDAGAPAPGAFRWIQHTTLLHPGDSGGPLTDVEGQLIAINTIAIWRRPWFSTKTTWTGSSIRPDLAWLQQLIESDCAAHPTPPEAAAILGR